MLDASGYYAGGIFTGNDYRMGNRDYCHELNGKLATYYQTGNVVFFNNSLMPFHVQNVNAKYRITLDGSYFQENIVRQTICMPKSCEYSDLFQVLSYNYNLFARNSMIKNADLIEVKILSEDFDLQNELNFAVLM